MGQVLVSSIRSFLMIGWILQCLKKVDEDWHWRTDLSEMQKCTWDFSIENLWERKMESSFSGYAETPFHQGSLECFPLEILTNLFEQGEETLTWPIGSASFVCSWSVWKMRGWTCHRCPPWARNEEKVSVWLRWPTWVPKDVTENWGGPAPWWTSEHRQLERNTCDYPWKSISIQW